MNCTRKSVSWVTLTNAFLDTFEDRKVNFTINKIMRSCTNLVTEGKIDEIYDYLTQILQEYFTNFKKSLNFLAGESLLSHLSEIYDKFKIYCSEFPQFCITADSYMVKERKEANKTINLVRKMFFQVFFSDPNFLTKTVTPIIISLIIRAQENYSINIENVQNVVDMYYSFKAEGGEIFADFKKRLEVSENEFYEKVFENGFYTRSSHEYIILMKEQYEIDKPIFEFVFRSPEKVEFLNLFVNAPIYEACANFVKNEILKIKPLFQNNTKSEASIVSLIITRACSLASQYEALFPDPEASSVLGASLRDALDDGELDFEWRLSECADALVRGRLAVEDVDEVCRMLGRVRAWIRDKTLFGAYFESSLLRRMIETKNEFAQFDLRLIDVLGKEDNFVAGNYDALLEQWQISERVRKAFAETSRKEPLLFDPTVFGVREFCLPISEPCCALPNREIVEINGHFIDFFDRCYAQQSILLVGACSTCEFELSIGDARFTIVADIPCATVLAALGARGASFGEIVSLFRDDRSSALLTVGVLIGHGVIKAKNQTESSQISSETLLILNPEFAPESATLFLRSPVEVEASKANDAKRARWMKEAAVRSAVLWRAKESGAVDGGALEMGVIEQLGGEFCCTKEMVWKEVDECGRCLRKEKAEDGVVVSYNE